MAIGQHLHLNYFTGSPRKHKTHFLDYLFVQQMLTVVTEIIKSFNDVGV